MRELDKMIFKIDFEKKKSENALKAEMNPIMTGTYGLPAILFNTFTNYRYATFLAQKTFRELTDKAMNDSAAAANGGTLKIATVTCPASESDTTDAIHQCSIGGNAVIERAISMSLSERFSATPCLSERVNVNKLPYETQIKLTDDVDDFGFVFGSPDKIWTRGKCRGVFEVRYIPGKEDKNSNEFVLPSDSPYKPLKEQDIYHLVMNNILIGQIAWYEALGKATEELDKDLEQAMQFGSDMAWLCAHKRLCYERKWSLRPVKGKAELLLDPVFSLQAPPKFVQKIKSGKLKGQLKKSIVLKATDWSAFLAWAGQYEHYNYLYTNLNQTGIEKGGEKTSALLREYAVERDFPCLENTKVAKSPTGKIEVPLKLRAAALNLIAYYKTMIELNHNRVTLCRVNPTPVPEGPPTPTMTPGVVPTVSPKTAVFMNPTGVNVADISNSSLTAGSANSAKSSSGDEGTFVSDRLGQGSNFGRAAFFDRAAERLADAKNAASRFAGTNPAWRKASSLLENMIASNVANNAAAGGLLSSTGTAPSSSLPSSTAASIAGKNILGTGASSVVMKGAGNVAGMQVGAAVDKNSDEDEEVDENADGVDEEEGDASENVAKRPSENLQGPICAYDASRNVFAGPSDNIFVSVMCAYRRHYPEAAQELGIPKLSSEVKK